MEKESRETGIEVIGKLPWGSHFCQFYETKQDLLDVLVPYFKAGLQKNEFCMWITAEPLDTAEATAALRKAIPNFEHYLEKGQIEILPHHKWYLKKGMFDSRRVLAGWVKKLDAARAKGFDGLRLTGNTFWLEKKDWNDFTDYERQVNEAIGKYQMLAICSYCLPKCSATEIMDVVSNHEFALIRRKKRWELIEGSNIAKRAQRESEEKYRKIVDTAAEGIVVAGLDGKFSFANQKMADMLGYSVRELLGKPGAALGFGGQQEEIRQNRKRLSQGDVLHGEFRFRRKDGGELWTLYNASPIFDEEGRHTGNLAMHTDITERKKAEQRLESVAKFPDENPYAVLRLEKDGTLLYANPASKPLMQKSGWVIGKKVRGKLAKQLKIAFRSKERKELELEFNEKKYLFFSVPIQGASYINLYGIDISRRKKAEEELRQTRDYLDNLLNYANAPVIVWGPNFRITLFNHAFEKLTGLQAKETIGKRLDILFPPEDRKKSMQQIYETIAGERWEIREIPIQRIDGTVRTVLWNSAGIFSNDKKKIVATIAQGQDITERKEAEEGLKQAYEKLKRVDDLKSSILRDVSHELRHPISLITMATDVLENELQKNSPDREKLGKYLGILKRNSGAFDKELSAVVELSKLQTTENITKENVDLAQVIRGVIQENAEFAGKKGLFLKEKTAPFLLATANKVMLESLVRNLVTNAIKYTESGGVKISCQHGKRSLVISVKDTGMGVSEKNQGRLFEPFFKADVASEGLGVGLAICKKVVELHSGKLLVESALGKGSTFTVLLPENGHSNR